jgi:hypothetical protein
MQICRGLDFGAKVGAEKTSTKVGAENELDIFYKVGRIGALSVSPIAWINYELVGRC